MRGARGADRRATGGVACGVGRPAGVRVGGRVVVCWVQLGGAERRYLAALERGMRLRDAEAWDRHVERAQKRWLMAVRGLEGVGRREV